MFTKRGACMFGLGGLEIVIVLVVVLLLFGPGRIAKVAGELGKGVKAFKDGITGTEKEENNEDNKKAE